MTSPTPTPAGTDLLARVRSAQEELGAGDPEDALAAVEPLLTQTRNALHGMDFLRRTPRDRAAVVEAYCYARVTAVLALEAAGANRALPRIRDLAAEARDVATPTNPGWKVLCAAAEMLARCGDGQGAVRAAEDAVTVSPDGEDYPLKVRASIRSMFGQGS